MPVFSLSSLRFRFFATGISLILLLIGAELILRQFVPVADKFYVWPPNLRTELPAAPSGGRARFTVTSLGVRGTEPHPDAHAEYRILVFGGSVVENLFLDDATTWPILLQERLKHTADGRKVWVGNVGKSGMHSRDYVVQLRYLLSQMPHVDMFILLAGMNDLTWRLRYGNENSAEFLVTGSEVGWGPFTRAFAVVPSRGGWYTRTAFYGFLKRVKRFVLSSQSREERWQQTLAQKYTAAFAPEAQKAVLTVDTLPDLAWALGQYEKNLQTIVDLAKAHGVRVVLLTYPVTWYSGVDLLAEPILWKDEWRPWMDLYHSPRVVAEGMKLYNQQLLRVCESRNIECIDLASEISPRLGDFSNGLLSKVGAQNVAATVGEYCAKREPFLQASAKTD